MPSNCLVRYMGLLCIFRPRHLQRNITFALQTIAFKQKPVSSRTDSAHDYTCQRSGQVKELQLKLTNVHVRNYVDVFRNTVGY